MATPVNRLVRRRDLTRPLSYQEGDSNLDYGNFWQDNRSYAQDMVVIHNENFYRALVQSTQGSFISGEWQLLGSAGSGTLGVLGLPSSGLYGPDTLVPGDLTNIVPGDTVEDAFDKVEHMLVKLAPANASLLSDLSLDIPGTFSASQLTSGTVKPRITIDTTPTATVSNYFRDGDRGILQASIDSTNLPAITLSFNDESGTYANSTGTITIVETPYPIAPANPFYSALSANMTSVPALSLSGTLHTYSINHNTPSSTLSTTFYVDALSTPTITPSTVVGVYATSAKYISGVPSLQVGDSLRCTYTVGNAVSWFYNTTRITSATSTYATGGDVTNSPIPTTHGANFTVTNFNQIVLTGKTTEAATVTYTAYNARGTQGGDTSNTTVTTSIRIDTLSTESNRLKAGVGHYPTLGTSTGQAGDTFVSSTSLATSGNEELQMYFGKYRYPAGNYTSNLPTAGPDYSSVPLGTYNNVRWVLLNLGTTTGFVNSVTLTFDTPTNFGTNKIIPNFYLQVRIPGGSGTTGWIDGNVAYTYGNPTNNGDAAFNYGASTVSTRNITFGTSAKSGNVYVRVGIPSGSTISFKNIILS